MPRFRARARKGGASRIRRLGRVVALALALLAGLTLLLASIRASAADERIVGMFCGEIWSAGKAEPSRTVIAVEGGKIVGHYEFAENRGEVVGRLALRSRKTATEIAFTWTDKYGKGPLVLRFADDFGSFRGRWGAEGQPPRYEWNGRRCLPQSVRIRGPASRDG